jgi:1-deoxy-D-xylulose-5-phosphate synthase
VALLESVSGPADLKRLAPEQLPQLAAEIRDFLVEAVARTGGHLGPNLGVVELTIALHRVFDSPRDRVVWDTGHQTYVHKLLTGRQDFSRLRQKGGLSGYPSAAESDHDVVENSHASTSLSYAEGLSRAYKLRGEDRAVVAVIGDGALTGGMAWEALNQIAADQERRLVVVVNDNARSYAPTVGGLADHLATLRLTPGYEETLETVRAVLERTPIVGGPLFDALHGIKRGLKDLVQPQVMFEDLGLKYVGPIDGHDVGAVESALRRARDFGRPVLVHTVTRKGFGYRPAEDDEADCLHATGVMDPVTGRAVAASTAPSWTSMFSDEIVAIASERPEVVALTAAMLEPVGLKAMATAYPDRVVDVGIAEQHAVTSAAGLAMGGLRPVVCLYATFLNRAFDQVLLDVALHRQPVVFVLDRAGVTGPDGASHHGVWDTSILQAVPGLAIAAPRDATRLRRQLREALAQDDGPAVVRFPKGSVGADVPAVGRVGGMDVLRQAERPDVLLLAVGPMAATGLQVADRLASHGVDVTVVDPQWVKPVDAQLPALAAGHRLVVVLEDGSRVGGVGSTVAQALRDADVDVPVREFGTPPRFLDHAERGEVLAEIGLTAQAVARRVVETVARLEPGFDETESRTDAPGAQQ